MARTTSTSTSWEAEQADSSREARDGPLTESTPTQGLVQSLPDRGESCLTRHDQDLSLLLISFSQFTRLDSQQTISSRLEEGEVIN